MKSCYTVKELQRAMNKKINDALREDVEPYVREKLKQHIQHDVYDSYNPKVYKRRMEDDGLIDDANIRSKVERQTLSVYEEADMAEPLPDQPMFTGPDALAKLIEHGAPNRWNRRHFVWNRPRPFVTRTQREINRGHRIISNMIEKHFYK